MCRDPTVGPESLTLFLSTLYGFLAWLMVIKLTYVLSLKVLSIIEIDNKFLLNQIKQKFPFLTFGKSKKIVTQFFETGCKPVLVYN